MNLLVGGFCLAVLWTAALLVAGAVLQDLRELWALRARLRPLSAGQTGVGVVVGEVREGLGPGGVMATSTVTQRGRALERGRAGQVIDYEDVSAESCVHGGALRALDLTIIVRDETRDGRVWTSPRGRGARCSVADGREGEVAYAAACTAKGHTRLLTTELRTGDRVFVAGEVTGSDDELRLSAPAGGALIASHESPRATVLRACAGLAAFVFAELAACVACTVLATWPPVFGRVSTVGAALGLALFLGITPLAVWIQDRARSAIGAADATSAGTG